MMALMLAGCAPSPSADTRPAPASPSPAAASPACVSPGEWVDGVGARIEETRVLDRAAGSAATLLGESHDDSRHHHWQLQVLEAIHRRNPILALGMEMFPRRIQPVLDQWTAGELDETTFLRRSEWTAVWGFPPELYLPLLRFARDNHLPVIALNVERSLVRKTARGGWASVPVSEREGVGDPAPVSAAYRARLNAIMGGHGPAKGPTGEKDEVERAARTDRFVQAQSVWDRAMAEAIAQARHRTGRSVVAITGSGHLRFREGVPHQLAALGMDDAMILLPWNPDDDCEELKSGGLADAVFGVPLVR